MFLYAVNQVPVVFLKLTLGRHNKESLEPCLSFFIVNKPSSAVIEAARGFVVTLMEEDEQFLRLKLPGAIPGSCSVSCVLC